MKKKSIIVLLCVCFSVFLPLGAFAGNGFSPIKFCLWNGVLGVPSGSDIYGLNFGLTNFTGEKQSVNGLDLGLFCSQSENVNGIQLSPANMTDHLNGLEISASGNYAKNLNGMQIGLVNRTTNSDFLIQFGIGNDAFNAKSSFQCGLYNRSDDKTHGFQIGFMNCMENGFLPVFPLINFSI